MSGEKAKQGKVMPMDPSIPPQRLLGIVQGLARELRPHAPEVERLGLDHSLERDFGLDSLARTELLARIERELGARLNEEALTSAETPRDLLRLAGIATPAADRDRKSVV